MMGPRGSVHRINLERPADPASDSKISVEDRLSEPIGVHLIDGDSPVLFGTGYESTVSQLSRTLPRKPDVVVVEHGDPDHYGAVPALREEIEGLTVAAPAGDRERFVDAGVGIDSYLEDGDECFGFEAIHVPGLTHGNMSFLDPERELLVVGDSFTRPTVKPRPTGSGAFAPLTAEFNTDFHRACESLQVLAERPFDAALLTKEDHVLEHAGEELKQLLVDLVVRR